MVKCIVCCSQGMSSSALMQKMRNYISEKNIEMEVKASTVDSLMSGNEDFDILMIGPQIRYEKGKLEKRFSDKVVAAIPMLAYGRLNGEEVVNLGLQLLDEKNKAK